MQALPDLLTARDGSHLKARADDAAIDQPQALLVSNNSYGTGDLAGAGRRLRLDEGRLGVLAVRIGGALGAVRLAGGVHSPDITRMTADQVVVDSDQDLIPAGVDGESVLLPRPVRCSVRPGALRVRVPRHRPGLAQARPPVRLGDLIRIAIHGAPAG
jgi:diacylglycerol kinase family enzyme